MRSPTSGRGHGRVVLLGGEPGIGKTTLLEALAGAADPRALTAWGRCPEVPGAPAFWPWRRVLRTVVDAVGDAELRAIVDADTAAVGHLAPDVTARTGLAPPPTGDDPTTARFVLYDAVVTLLGRVSRSTPVVLLLDDLHWADEPSLELLAHVGSELARSPVLVAASYRDAPADRPRALDAALATLSRLPSVVALHLDGLASAHVRALVEREVGGAVEETTVALVADRAAGNPFFVRQLASLLTEAAGDPAAPTTLPTGVRHVLARRIQRLSEPAQTVLEVAAVVGRGFDVEVVADAADRPHATVLAALDEASDHGLVTAARPTETHLTGTRHRFVHALVRETLYDGLSPARSAQLHAAVGAALEAAGTATAAEIVEHLWAGVTSTHDERPVRCAVRAADEAVASFASSARRSSSAGRSRGSRRGPRTWSWSWPCARGWWRCSPACTAGARPTSPGSPARSAS